MTYERTGASGHLAIVRSEKVADLLRVRFQRPVPLRQAKSMRKLLELTDDFSSLLADDKGVYGLGSRTAGRDVVEITVTNHAEWELSIDGTALMRVAYGHATLPRPLLDEQELRDTAERVVGPIRLGRIWKIIRETQGSARGTAVVVAREPEVEIARLGAEAVPIEPKLLEPAEVGRLSRVDGAILLGPDGRCHAFGVILDGVASGRGDPARGSRFNSAVRYQSTEGLDSIVIVVSDDGAVDLIPRLRPRVSRTIVEEAWRAFLACCEAEYVDGEEFSRTYNQVRELAFYLDDNQCRLVNECHENEMLSRFEGGGMRVIEAPLQPDPNMNESYFL